MTFRILAATLLCALVAGPVRAETRLLMAEEAGCIYCAHWNAEIGSIYAKTGEGQAAPLRRIDKAAPLPDDITLLRPVSFTPTFVLLINGTEVARIEGYPGEDFFWGLLGQMLEQHNVTFEVNQAPTAPKT